MLLNPKNSPHFKQQGQALLEMALALPVLIFLFISIVELGIALNTYLAVNRAAYEGARFAASLPGLESATLDSHNAPDAPLPKQSEVQVLVHKLLEGPRLKDLDFRVVTEYTPGQSSQALLSGGTVRASSNMLSVLIQTEYRPMFIGPPLPISVVATSPYLYPYTAF